MGLLHDDCPMDDTLKATTGDYYAKGIRIWQVCPHLFLALGRRAHRSQICYICHEQGRDPKCQDRKALVNRYPAMGELY